VDDQGWYEEETKVRHELRKILDLADLAVTCTATRVPVPVGHAAACRVLCARRVTRDDALRAFASLPGVEVDPDPAGFCTPAEVAGETLVRVGRLRGDPDDENALLMWVVADNLLKGAAWNAVQIAEGLAEGRG
jgi:aspartate-semialdehyde dehydrogenase